MIVVDAPRKCISKSRNLLNVGERGGESYDIN